MTDWDPEEHPRNPEDGRFVEKRTGEGWIQRLSEQIEPAIRYFHGTTREDLEEILPATHENHYGPVLFPADTNPEYAYATEVERDAWHYAEKAHAAGDAGTLPRVYEVEPINPDDVEEDEFYTPQGRPRSILEADRRSRSGWRVIREMPWPEEYGDPEDWR